MAETKIRVLNILGHIIPMVFFIGIRCPNGIQHTNNVQLKAKRRVELLQIATRNIVNEFSHTCKLNKSVQL